MLSTTDRMLLYKAVSAISADKLFGLCGGEEVTSRYGGPEKAS